MTEVGEACCTNTTGCLLRADAGKTARNQAGKTLPAWSLQSNGDEKRGRRYQHK